MSQRTVTTPEAHQTARDMANLITGELTGTVTRLREQGKTLSEKQNWDGGLATQFSGTVWPGVDTALGTMLKQLGELQEAIATVNRNISAAGN
jgi:hypothetical protein